MEVAVLSKTKAMVLTHYQRVFIFKNNRINRFTYSLQNNPGPFKHAIKICVILYGAKQKKRFVLPSNHQGMTSPVADYGTEIHKTVKIHEYFHGFPAGV